MLEKIKPLIKRIKTSKRAKIGLAVLGVVVLIFIVLMLIGQREVKKEYSQLPEQERIMREKSEGNIIQKMGRYLKKGTDKVSTDLRLKKAKEIPISPTPSGPFTTPPPSPIIQKQVINWLNSMKNLVALQCRNGQCQDLGTDRQRGISILWGRFQYYLNSKDPQELSLIKNEISQYAEMTGDQPFQADFWHCWFMNDIYEKGSEEKIFSAKENENLKTICKETIYFMEEAMRQSEKNINDFDGKKIIEAIQNSTTPTNSFSLLPKNSREFLLYVTAASDGISRYFLLNQPSRLYLSKAYFDRVLDYFLINKEKVFNEAPFLALAALDIHKATANDQYLNLAKFLADYLEQEKKESNIFYLTGMAFLTKRLYLETNQPQYLTLTNKYLSTLTNYYFDSQGLAGFRQNKQAFHNRGENVYIFDARLNSLIVYLLSSTK
jgi:hypothetical protein